MRRPSAITSVLLCLLLLVHYSSESQLYHKARILTTQNGLSNNIANCFFEDHTGFMWIGTSNGLNKYDGHSFTVFRPGPGNSISNEIINSITGDQKGNIWVATMDGLNQYDPSTGKWETLLPVSEQNRQDIPSNLIWQVEADEAGLLWLAPDVFEFCSYDPAKKKFTYYDWPGFSDTLDIPENPRYRSVHKFVRKNDHEFWLGTTVGLVHLDIRSGRFRLIGGAYSSNVKDLVYDRIKGKVYVSVLKGRLFVYDEIKNNYEELFPVQEEYPSSKLPSYKHKGVWLASDQGLVKINTADQKPTLEKNIPELSGSLLPGMVQSVFTDPTGITWVGTSNGVGIYDIQASSAFLPLLRTHYTEGSNRMGSVIYDEKEGHYFVCANDSGIVFMIKGNDGRVRKIGRDAEGKAFTGCNALRKDLKGEIWLLTDTAVYIFNRSLQQFVRFSTPADGTDAGYKAFVEDRNGDYWIGSFKKGLFHYSDAKKNFVPLADSLLESSLNISSLYFDSAKGYMWIGAYGKDVFRYHPDTRKLASLQDSTGFLQMNLPCDIFTDRSGITWIATHSGGIFKHDPTQPFGRSVKQFTMKTGLPFNYFISISADSKNTLWLLSPNGLCAIDSSGQLVYDGQQSGSFPFSAYTSDSRSPHNLYFNRSKNELLMAVGGGILFFAPPREKIILNFPMLLTSARAGKKDLDIRKANQELSFQNNSVTIKFAGLYYGIHADELRYEYRLTGYDPEWRNAGDKFAAEYQNLPPGSYHFEARAIGSNGIVAARTSGFFLSIVPPFWKTWWFVVIVSVFLGSIVFWWIKRMYYRLEEEKLVSSFATSLYGQSRIEDICWDTARSCVVKLGFTDCVVYVFEEDRQLLIQKAAYGPKNPLGREIYNSIDIPLGKGIVGSVAKAGKAEIVSDTRKDGRYIIDDENRLSEIAVPMLIDSKLFGVIDSEHPEKNFYSRHHLRVLKRIAAICSERISKYLSEERLRGKIARDLHDEMGSTLTSIKITSRVAMENETRGEKISHYLKKIEENSGRMMESMSDIVWMINPSNDNFEKLVFRIKEFTAELLEPAKINYHFREEGNPELIPLNLEQRKDIYMIFKEALTNIVKYSQASEVSLLLAGYGPELVVIIEDNGIGFDKAAISKGNGLANMKSRASQIKADLRIDTSPGEGCRISLRLTL